MEKQGWPAPQERAGDEGLLSAPAVGTHCLQLQAISANSFLRARYTGSLNPWRQTAIVSPCISAKGEELFSHRAPSGMAGASRKCSKVGGKAASVLPGSTHPGHCSFPGCRATRAAIQLKSLTTPDPKFFFFFFFSFPLPIRQGNLFLYSNKVLLVRATQNYRCLDNHALLVSLEACCCLWYSGAALEEQNQNTLETHSSTQSDVLGRFSA